MYLLFGYMFRRVDMELFDTTYARTFLLPT